MNWRWNENMTKTSGGTGKGRLVFECLLLTAALLAVGAGVALPFAINAGVWTAGWPEDLSSSPLIWLVAAASLACLFSGHRKLDLWFERHPAASLATAAGVCVFFSWMALHAALDSRFGAIDDHEIIRYLGIGKSKADWDDWFTLWKSTEVGGFGDAGRFRPGYYALRIAEACVWGKNVAAWYGFRIFLCASLLVAVWRLASQAWGASVGFSMAFALVGMPSVADMFARLGPSETYGIPALALGIWAWSQLWTSPRQLRWMEDLRWWCGAALLMMAVLSKENLVLFMMPLLGWTGWTLWRKKQGQGRAHAAWSVGLVAVSVLFMCVIMVRMQMIHREDVYGADAGAATIFQSLFRSVSRLLLGEPLIIGWFFLGAACVWLALAGSRAKEGGVVRSTALTGFLPWLVLGVLFWMTQAVAYRDPLWPDGSRYDQPAVLVSLSLMTGVMICTGRWLLERTGSDVFLRVVTRVILCGCLLGGGSGVVQHTMRQAEQNTLRSRRYWSWIDKLADAAKASPDAPVVLLPGQPSSQFEPVAATFWFLRHKKVMNPVYYSTAYLEKDKLTSALDRKLLVMIDHGFTQDLKAAGLRHEKGAVLAHPDAIYVAFDDDVFRRASERGPRLFEPPYEHTLK
jgi:hypothetical protein